MLYFLFAKLKGVIMVTPIEVADHIKIAVTMALLRICRGLSWVLHTFLPLTKVTHPTPTHTA